MKNFITVSVSVRKKVQFPTVELCQLPAKMSKRLWIGPKEMVSSIHALDIAEWAIEVSQPRRALPEGVRRGRKTVYRDSSILIMALIQVAWQMSYEDVGGVPLGGDPPGPPCPPGPPP